MAIYVFSKWESAAILNFCRSKIWRYFCFRDVGFSLWAKLCANMCNCDRVMAKWIFKMAAAAILHFLEVKFDDTGSHGRPVSISTPNLVKISQRAAELWRFMFFFQNGGRPPSWIFASKIWRYFCFRDVGFSLCTKFCANMCNFDRVIAV